MDEEEEEKSKLQLVQELAKTNSGPPDRYILPEEDRSNSAPPLASDVPVIDICRLVSTDNDREMDKLSYALQTWGVFQVIGHDFSPSFLDEVHDVARKFFQLPIEEKEKYSNLKNGEFDLEGYGNDNIYNDDQIIDWNDRLYLRVQPEDRRRLECWPKSPNSFREILQEFTIKSRKLTEHLLLAMAKILKLDENYFTNLLDDRANAFARFTYYPSCLKPDHVNGIKPHTDGSVLTIVLPDKEVEGLQVLIDGSWAKVPIVPHALVINLGNQMEIMSNGIFVSPMHKVATSSRERISLAMFYELEPEKILEPAEALINETRPHLYRKMVTQDFLVPFFEKFAIGDNTTEWLRT